MYIQHPPAKHISSNSHFKIVSHITKNEFNEQHANPDCSYRMDKPHHQIGTFYPVNSDFDSHRIFSITQTSSYAYTIKNMFTSNYLLNENVSRQEDMSAESSYDSKKCVFSKDLFSEYKMISLKKGTVSFIDNSGKFLVEHCTDYSFFCNAEILDQENIRIIGDSANILFELHEIPIST